MNLILLQKHQRILLVMTRTMFDVRLAEAKSRVFEFDLPKNENVQVCSMFKKMMLSFFD